MRFVAVAGLALFLVACGSSDRGDHDGEDTADGDPDSGTLKPSLYINTAAELPDCTEAEERWLIYVQEDAAFKTCSAGSWVDVDINAQAKDDEEIGSEEDIGATGNGKRIVDADDRNVGELVNEANFTIRLNGTTHLARLTSLGAGFSKTGDYNRCMFLMNSCEGTCILPYKTVLAAYQSPSEIHVPTDGTFTVRPEGAHKILSETGSDLSCKTYAPADFKPAKNNLFSSSKRRSYKLPFRILD